MAAVGERRQLPGRWLPGRWLLGPWRGSDLGVWTRDPDPIHTTTTDACREGLSAGNSVSALRDRLVAAGNQVYTAPAQIGPGQVSATTGIGSSNACPSPLPAAMTIDTTAGIDQGGEHLAAFLSYLHDEHGVTAIHFVSHSMGGLFSRSAIGQVRSRIQGLAIRSVTTLSTPWTGAYPTGLRRGFAATIGLPALSRPA